MKRQIALVALALSLVASLAMAADDESVDVSDPAAPTSKVARTAAGYYLGLGLGAGEVEDCGVKTAVSLQFGYRVNQNFRMDLSINGVSYSKDSAVSSISTVGYGTLPINHGKIVPYAGLGFGHLSFSWKEDGKQKDANSEWGLALAAGTDFVLNRNWAAAVDLRYQSGSGVSLTQVTGGLKYYF